MTTLATEKQVEYIIRLVMLSPKNTAETVADVVNDEIVNYISTNGKDLSQATASQFIDIMKASDKLAKALSLDVARKMSPTLVKLEKKTGLTVSATNVRQLERMPLDNPKVAEMIK